MVIRGTSDKNLYVPPQDMIYMEITTQDVESAKKTFKELERQFRNQPPYITGSLITPAGDNLIARHCLCGTTVCCSKPEDMDACMNEHIKGCKVCRDYYEKNSVPVEFTLEHEEDKPKKKVKVVL